MVEFSTLGMVKVRGTIKHEEVVILVDCGATNNLIFDSGRETQVTTNFEVIMGTRTAVRGKGICKGME